MTRALLREHIFKIIFSLEFHNKEELEEQLNLYLKDNVDIAGKDEKYITKKVLLIGEMLPEIDEKINEISEGWPVNRIGKAELSILRLATYEVVYDDDIPVNVAIDQAVELSKKFGQDNSPAYINGVLAKLIK